jgi:glycerol-3-phosphate cytidylyltransferase
MIRVITFGTFDLFHVGHLNLLRRAKQLGDYLIVGVSTDKLNYSKKKRLPIFSEPDRVSIKYVDETFLEESLELKPHYIKKFSADILVMGDDWQGKFDFCKCICRVVYLKRTEGISTTEIKSGIKDYL